MVAGWKKTALWPGGGSHPGGIPWARIEPLQKGVRVEVHLNEADDSKAAIAALVKVLGKH